MATKSESWKKIVLPTTSLTLELSSTDTFPRKSRAPVPELPSNVEPPWNTAGPITRKSGLGAMVVLSMTRRVPMYELLGDATRRPMVAAPAP